MFQAREVGVLGGKNQEKTRKKQGKAQEKPGKTREKAGQNCYEKEELAVFQLQENVVF